MDDIIEMAAWTLLAGAGALSVGALRQQSRFGVPKTPRSRLMTVGTLLLIGVAACLGTWLIPAIVGAFAAGMVLVVRDHRNRGNRDSPFSAQE